MYAIVGLGNPGRKYEKTRHNAGFAFVEQLADYFGWDSYYDVTEWEFDDDRPYAFCEAKADGDVKMLFVKPMLFMNESGVAVRHMVKEHDVNLRKQFVLVHDDLDIDLGKYKIQRDVSPKVHRGVKNVERMLDNAEFTRIRVGIDNRSGDRSVPGEEYVLEKMNDDELVVLDETIADAVKQFRMSFEL